MERYGPFPDRPYLPSSNQKRQNIQTSHETAVLANFPIARPPLSSYLQDHADVQQNTAVTETSIRRSPPSSSCPSPIPSHGRTSSSIPAGGQKEKPTRMQILEEQESSSIAMTTFRQRAKDSTPLPSPGSGSGYGYGHGSSYATGLSPPLPPSPAPHHQTQAVLPANQSSPSPSPSSSMRVPPSKWDEAERWLTSKGERGERVSSRSSYGSHKSSPPPTSSCPSFPSSSSSLMAVQVSEEDMEALKQAEVRGLVADSPSSIPASSGLGTYPIARSSSGTESQSSSSSSSEEEVLNEGDEGAIMAIRHLHHVKESHRDGTMNLISGAFSPAGLNMLDECTAMVKEEVDKCSTMVKEELSPHYANYIRSIRMARENQKASCSNVFQQGKQGIVAHMSPPFNNNRASSRCKSEYWATKSSSVKPSSPLPMARHNSPEYASASSTIYQTCNSSSSTSSSTPLRVDAARLANYELAKLVLSKRSSPLHYKMHGGGKNTYYGNGDDEEAEITCQSSSEWPNMVQLNRSTSYWSSREEEEEEAEQSLRNGNSATLDEEKLMHENVMKARASAWEEIERSKCLQRNRRKEAEIEAWEKRKKEKAQFELKKLEEKLERMRKQEREKILNNLATTQKRAEEMKAIAKIKQLQEMDKLRHRAQRLYASSQSISNTGRLSCVHHLHSPFTSCNCLFLTRQ